MRLTLFYLHENVHLIHYQQTSPIVFAKNFLSGGGKLSIQFSKPGKKYSKKIKVIAQIYYCLIINFLKIIVL